MKRIFLRSISGSLPTDGEREGTRVSSNENLGLRAGWAVLPWRAPVEGGHAADLRLHADLGKFLAVRDPRVARVQGLLDRSPADLQFRRQGGFLDAFSGADLTGHDPFAQIVGDLLRQSVGYLKIHKGSLNRGPLSAGGWRAQLGGENGRHECITGFRC